MDISEVVALSGLKPSTLHHYEAKGLIQPTGRNGLRRQYGAEVLDRLALISLGRDAGFSLSQIGDMMPLGQIPDLDRQLLSAKADELDDVIDALVITRDSLRHAAGCKAPSHLECKTFRVLLDGATRRRTG